MDTNFNMNRNKKLTRVISLLFLLLTNTIAITAQVKKQLSAAELKQWEVKQGQENYLSKVPAAKKEKGEALSRILLAYAVKHFLHETDATKYPLDENRNDIEKAVAAAISSLSPATKKKLSQQVIINLKNPIKTESLGKLKAVDFTKKSINSEIERLMPGESVKVFKKSDRIIAQAAGKPEIKMVDRVELALRDILCVDQTNPEGGSNTNDDMILSGILIGCSGNVKAIPSVLSCHFKDGGLCDHGNVKFGSFDMNSCAAFPKTFICVFKLVEADDDMQGVANTMDDLMSMVASICAGLKEYHDAEEIAVSVAYTMDDLPGMFTNDADFFPSRIVFYTMQDRNSFGSDGHSDDMTTTNISGNGGVYRIGFSWRY